MDPKIKATQHEMFSWQFSFQEGPLSSTAQIDKISQQCKLFKAPTIIFGSNFFNIQEKTTGFKLLYNAKEALRYINFEERKTKLVGLNEQPKINTICYIPERLKVKHAHKWQNIEKPKDIEITQIEESSDTFFISPFKGLISGQAKLQRVGQSVIPVHKLGPNNPIKFYSQGFLYEDQLDDNGLVQYQYKFRAMESSWFALIRFYIRVDDVAIIILDTRIYWQQGQDKISRQFMVKKGKWEQIKSKGFQFEPQWSMDPNQSHKVYPFLEEQLVENEFIHFK